MATLETEKECNKICRPEGKEETYYLMTHQIVLILSLGTRE